MSGLREEVARRPYLALLAAGGLGSLLAGGHALRILPRWLESEIRLAIATTLPAFAELGREISAPE
jgi:hypothetical protein